MSERLTLKELRESILKDAYTLEKNEAIRNDNRFNKPTPKEQHEAAYTDILEAYSENVKETIRAKRRYKNIVFWVSMGLLCLTFISLIIIIIVFASNKQQPKVVEWCSVLIPALVSFLTVFIVIPKVITRYLFNSEEEKYMSEIIKSVQNYDKD